MARLPSLRRTYRRLRDEPPTLVGASLAAAAADLAWIIVLLTRPDARSLFYVGLLWVTLQATSAWALRDWTHGRSHRQGLWELVHLWTTLATGGALLTAALAVVCGPLWWLSRHLVELGLWPPAYLLQALMALAGLLVWWWGRLWITQATVHTADGRATWHALKDAARATHLLQAIGWCLRGDLLRTFGILPLLTGVGLTWCLPQASVWLREVEDTGERSH